MRTCNRTIDFELNQGSDKFVSFVFKDKEKKPIDFTGFEFAMQIRKHKDDPKALDTLTTKNERIEVFPKEGKLLIKLIHKKTETFPSSRLVYDIEMISADNNITRIVEGKIAVSGEVTRV